jgi:hypothetical protein
MAILKNGNMQLQTKGCGCPACATSGPTRAAAPTRKFTDFTPKQVAESSGMPIDQAEQLLFDRGRGLDAPSLVDTIQERARAEARSRMTPDEQRLTDYFSHEPDGDF